MAYQTPVIISTIKPRIASGRGLFGLIWISALYAAFGFVILVIGLMTGISYENPMVMGTMMGFLIMAPVMWYRPSLGAYILVGGAAVFETFPLGFPDSIFDESVFFQAFRSAGGPRFMLFNAAEMVMGFSLITVILHRIAARERSLELGSMFWAVGFYTAHSLGTRG